MHSSHICEILRQHFPNFFPFGRNSFSESTKSLECLCLTLISVERFCLKSRLLSYNIKLHPKKMNFVTRCRISIRRKHIMSGLCETFGVGLMEVPVKDIIPNPHQPRKRFREKDIERLSDSIRRVGVINPISVMKTGNTNLWRENGDFAPQNSRADIPFRVCL